MANIADYLDWRGDITFDTDPFNEIDNLILSQITYVDLKDFVPSVEQGGRISLKEAVEDFFDLHEEEELLKDQSFIRMAPFFMRQVSNTLRFKDVYLSNFVDIIDVESEMQFCAFHFELGDGTTYIAFRGTDDTLVGWKENFNMSFLTPVPAQKEAEQYVNTTVKSTSCKVRLGGHSKGGNLAIYAAVKCLPRVKDRIIYVYNNDGPGFDFKMINDSLYQAMLPKIKTIVPEHSVVGMLLEHEEEYMVVQSNQVGILQHDAMSWQVLGNRFVTVDNVSKESASLNRILSKWINDMTLEEREKFVETMFSIIKSTGVNNISEINLDFFQKASLAIKAFQSIDSRTRWVLSKLLYSITGEFAKNRIKERHPTK